MTVPVLHRFGQSLEEVRIKVNPLRATHVQVEERLDGTMRITHHGRPLDYQAIAARPVRVPAPSTVSIPQRPVKPTPDHPWRKRLLPERGQHAAADRT